MWRFGLGLTRRVPAVLLAVTLLAPAILAGCAPAAPAPPTDGAMAANGDDTSGAGDVNGAKTAPPTSGTDGAANVAADPAAVPNGTTDGFYFEGLPKIYCCSSALLGWSEITVGSQVPLQGRVVVYQGDAIKGPIRELKLVSPSGKELSIPVGEDGSFGQTVLFDEEGFYRLFRVTSDAAADKADTGISFAAAYRVDTLDTPTVQSVFGPQHRDLQANKMVALPQGKTTQFRIRFVDAAGNPARQQTLRAFGGETEGLTTNTDGIATLTFTPEQNPGWYDLGRLYPGLAVLSYNTVEGGASGRLTGLAGGSLDGIKENGQWYYPLGEFLKRAFPFSFADGIHEDGPLIQLMSDYGSFRLTTIKTIRHVGQVLNQNDDVVLQVQMINRPDGPWLTLPDLARLFDLLAWGTLTPDGKLLVAAPIIP